MGIRARNMMASAMSSESLNTAILSAPICSKAFNFDIEEYFYSLYKGNEYRHHIISIYKRKKPRVFRIIIDKIEHNMKSIN